jgi:hypothetical protein
VSRLERGSALLPIFFNVLFGCFAAFFTGLGFAFLTGFLFYRFGFLSFLEFKLFSSLNNYRI